MLRVVNLIPILCVGFAAATAAAAQGVLPKHPHARNFALVFQDEFEGDALDWTVWDSARETKVSASGQRTYRGPDNAVVADGLLKLFVRKERVGDADWTAAFVWLRENFGPNTYYEARLINTRATGINNAFWTVTKTATPATFANRYEIDAPESKLHTDGKTHAHLAWHDWKSYRPADGQHVAQGVQVVPDDAGFQTWGLWIGENGFEIYYEGELQWDGKAHPRYRDQWCSGMGKLERWTDEEERRAYGKHGQDDWCYDGGMNGDVQNIAFSTIPWESAGTPLTDAADGAFMGIDYLRVFKRAVDLETTPAERIGDPPMDQPIALQHPIDLAGRGNTYISYVLRPAPGAGAGLSLASEDGTVATASVRPDGSMRLESGGAVADSRESYPARDRARSALRPDTAYLVVLRITAEPEARDIVSLKRFDLSAPVSRRELFLYHNVDAFGNTNSTSQWDLSQKLRSSAKLVTLGFDPDAARGHVSDLRIGPSYLSVVAEHTDAANAPAPAASSPSH